MKRKVIDHIFLMSARLAVIPLIYAIYSIISLQYHLNTLRGPGIWGFVFLPSTLLLGIGIILALFYHKTDANFRAKFDIETFSPLAVLAYIGFLLFIWSSLQYITYWKSKTEFADIIKTVEEKVREKPIQIWMESERKGLPTPFIPIIYNKETDRFAFTTKLQQGVAKNKIELKGILLIICKQTIPFSQKSTTKIKKKWIFDCWVFDWPPLQLHNHKTFPDDESSETKQYPFSYIVRQPWNDVINWVSEIQLNQ